MLQLAPLKGSGFRLDLADHMPLSLLREINIVGIFPVGWLVYRRMRPGGARIGSRCKLVNSIFGGTKLRAIFAPLRSSWL